MTRTRRKTNRGVDWVHGGLRQELKGDRIWHAGLFGNSAEIEYRRADYAHNEDPGWYYYGHGVFGRYLARTLDESLEMATDILFTADNSKFCPTHGEGCPTASGGRALS